MKRLSAIVYALFGGAILMLFSGCETPQHPPQQYQPQQVPSGQHVGDTRYVTEKVMTGGSKYTGPLELYQDGIWRQDGQGTYTWPDGQKYVGEFHHGKLNGQGTWTWRDGTKHVGEFRNGRPNGQGMETFPDGRKFEGEYRDGQANGQGIYTLPTGEKYVGQWRDGKRNGQGTERSRSGVIYDGLWQDDKFVGEMPSSTAHGSNAQ